MTTKMNTIMFIEPEHNKGRMVIGYHLNRYNYLSSNAPKGKIRIARFESSFWPQINRGYYGDIYFSRMIKKWKKKRREKEIDVATEFLIKKKLCDDLIMEILKYF